MNKYEQAIAYFEDAIKESDEIIADCSPDLQAELAEQKDYFVVALDALHSRRQGLYVIVEPCGNLPERLNQLRGKCCTYGDIGFEECLHVQERLKVLSGPAKEG